MRRRWALVRGVPRIWTGFKVNKIDQHWAPLSFQHSLKSSRPVTTERLQPFEITRWTADKNSSLKTTSDTIYALSTAPGRAAIAIVRISGPAGLTIYQGLCPSKPHPKARSATLRRLYDPLNALRVLDTGALILYFPSPDTVTGEDVLELHLHGGPAIVRSVLDSIPKCVRDGNADLIRHAEPGEFTKRAFYNGRLDLTQAEALGESLAAETEQQRRLAISGADGGLAARYEVWRSILLYARGELEALIDFSEDQHFDESPAEFMASVSSQVLTLKEQIEAHIRNASRGELLRSGINVALLGAPNAGKSSLLNQIVGRDAAIVSAEEGTTRDIVDVSIDIGGWLVRLGDMAGLRAKHDESNSTDVGAIEREGIRRARERALQADLVIVLISLHHNPESGLFELSINPELLSAVAECQQAAKAMLFVLNKIDLLHLQPKPPKVSLSALLSHLIEVFPEISPNEVFCLSCKDASNQDLQPLQNQIELDPGGIQTFLSGLTKTFGRMTAAVAASDVDMTPAEAESYWTASLSVTHRQSTYLTECLMHLDAFLAQSTTSNPTAASFETHHIDGHHDLVGERDRIREQDDFDIVTAAENLRYAANCLAKITGKGEGGDVEDVLGVVFEK